MQALITSLENNPAIIVPLVRAAPPAILKRRPAPAAWSIHEHACHLAAVHPVFWQRLDLMLAQDHPLIEPYQADAGEAPGALLDMDLDAALDRYTRERTRLVDRIKTLTPAEWQRTARHPEYSHYSVFIMFRHLALHDLAHAYEIEALLLKPEWAAGATTGSA